MKNDYCEEKSFSKRVTSFHEEEIVSYGAPKWANVDCPHCNSKLEMSSVRGIAARFNARNIGDITVEVFCKECSIMDTVYFRNQFKDIKGYMELLNGTKNPDCEPVVEEKMYKLQYNNLVEIMLKDEKS